MTPWIVAWSPWGAAACPGPRGRRERHDLYVFVPNGQTWSKQARLVASGAEVRRFPLSVGLWQDTAVVGALCSDPAWPVYPELGCAFLFARSGSTWSERAKLVPSDLTPTTASACP